MNDTDKDFNHSCIICDEPAHGVWPLDCTEDLQLPYCYAHLTETKNAMLADSDETPLGVA